MLSFVKSGWPNQYPPELRPFWFRRFELTVEGECLLWGIRVVVPEKLRNKVLEELHKDHPGISRMKTIARSYIWWPGVDKRIEEMVKSCVACQSVKHSPAVAPLQPWTWPNQPWKRVHLDFAGPFQGSMFLVAVDAHSKWPEVCIMKETTASQTIARLRSLFASFGLPEQLVTDNGPQFVSEEFSHFLKSNGIKHIRCAPYHPASNGLAERFVQSLKTALKANVNSELTLQHRISNFLLSYRSTPHTTTGVSPASLFLHRQLRTRLDLVRPTVESRVLSKQSEQKSTHDRRAQERQFFVGQTVMARNLRPGPEWVPAVVVERLGPLTYLVETTDQLIWKRHIDLLRELHVQSHSETPSSDDTEVVPADDIQMSPPPLVESQDTSAESEETQGTGSSTETPTVAENVSSHRYPTQDRQPPDRFGWYV